MAFFKTAEEKKAKEERKIKELEEKILQEKKFRGRVGHIHQGLNSLGVWGTLDNGKTTFKSTNFEIHDDKILIVRNRTLINLVDIKEIFHERQNEAIIILNKENGIPIKGKNNTISASKELKAFINVLNKLVKENKSKTNNKINENSNKETSENPIDRLIKLGEMYEKGLLTEDEFALMKQKFINETTEDTITSSNNDINSPSNICEKCGAKISPNDAFCSECGNKIH